MNIDFLEILKWVIITFIAGIIGYLGKYVGIILLQKVRKKEAVSQDKKDEQKKIYSEEVNKADDKKEKDNREKIEKKRRKAELKEAKKKSKQ